MTQNSFEEKITGYIKEHEMLKKGCSVTLGVSGGADSVCLFFVLLKLKEEYGLKLGVVHVMHGIRDEEAVRDMEFTKMLCEENGVDFRCVEEDVPKFAAGNGLSVEEAGRIVRYRAFEAEGADRIAVAHNLNDLAETVLFNLIRGSGIKGLAGINPVSGKIIRPLLCVKRQEIEEYLKSIGQSWCTDSTNLDNDYSRNRIRNVLLSEAQTINPRAVEHIAKNSVLLRQTEEYLSVQTKTAYDEYCREEGDRIYIKLEAAKKLHRLIFTRVILEAFFRLSGKRRDIASNHVDDTIGLFYKQSGKKVDLIYGLSAKRSFDEVVIEIKKEEDPKKNVEISLNRLIEEGSKVLHDGRILSARIIVPAEEENLKVSRTDMIDYDKIEHDILIRTRKDGDRISIKGGHKKVKDVLIDKKIPSEKRNDILLLANDNEVYWIGGIRVGSDCEVGKDTKRILQITVKEERYE